MNHDAENLAVFRAFVAASGLDVDEQSITCAAPPEPDIVCQVGGELRCFELTRAANEAIVRLNVDLHRRALRDGGAHYVTTPDPFAFLEDPLRKKGAKPYAVGRRVDLLLWVDNTKDHLPHATIQAMRTAVEHALQEHTARWREIWLFDLATSSVLARASAD